MSQKKKQTGPSDTLDNQQARRGQFVPVKAHMRSAVNGDESAEIIELKSRVEDLEDRLSLNTPYEEEELLDGDALKRIIEGESPVRVWRQYRGMTGQQLGDACGVTKSYISSIENGRKPGSLEFFKAASEALDTMIDDLVA